MGEEKRTLSCTDCGVLNCSKRNASQPEFCLTEKLTEKELEKICNDRNEFYKKLMQMIDSY